MVLVTCIDDTNFDVLKLNETYVAEETKTCYHILVKENNIKVSPRFKRSYIKGSKKYFIKRNSFSCEI